MKLKAKRLPAKKLSKAPGRDQLEVYAERKGMSLEGSSLFCVETGVKAG
jgi:hypothetical protein